MNQWDKFNVKMLEFSSRLQVELKISVEESCELASILEKDILALPKEEMLKFKTEMFVELAERMNELKANENFMDFADVFQGKNGLDPALTRAQVICQLYISFVYLGESCFVKMRKISLSGTALRKCCSYLTDFPVRGVRNSVAHSNWNYTKNCDGLIFHYFKDEARTELATTVFNQLDLEFSSRLAKIVSYVIFQTTRDLAKV